MKSTIFNYLSNSSSTLDTKEVLLCFIAATVIGIIIFVSYRITHSKTSYSGAFNASLVMMTVITTLVMAVIGNNVALSLGMVGALSIIRFRTAIKDSRDTIYIFWCIAAGICCGVSDFMLAGIGSIIVFLALVVFGAVKDDDRYLIIVRGSRDMESKVLGEISHFFSNKAHVKVNNSTADHMEMIFELPGSVYEKKSKNGNITDNLYELGNVDMVNIVSQSDSTCR